ncbi:MAG: FGGY family carbohydrate kinase [Flavihumibacter sp.]
MLLLGIDIGTSSVKVSVVDGQTQRPLASAGYPDTEAPIIRLQPGWAEQDPADWWERFLMAYRKLLAANSFDASAIGAIGIAYQMHGLVLVDKNGAVLRPSIIWCDSRAVPYGDKANCALGADYCLAHYLNAPGNFTAAKLAWVKENEPSVYEQVAKVMLPGDYIAFRMTGAVTASASSLSEGIFWDFTNASPADTLMEYFGFDAGLLPAVQPVFSTHGGLRPEIAALLQCKAGIPVSYKAGDQPNNALSLAVTEPGELAATAGTSGVIYAVSDKLGFDPLSRVNSFAHVNHTAADPRIGILLCINGAGILYSWAKRQWAPDLSYNALNALAAQAPPGSNGLSVLPFGNGAERILENKQPGVVFDGIDLNQHSQADLFRGLQEGIAFSFRYGLDIMRSNGLQPTKIRAGYANLFQSDVFLQSFVGATGVPVSLYQTDGSTGAALGAGIGAGFYTTPQEAFSRQEEIRTCTPAHAPALEEAYQRWLGLLQTSIKNV